MDTLKIHSKLYDYTVDFVEDIASMLCALKGETMYVIDKNVYRLYEDKLTEISKEHIYYMDPLETKKNMDTVLDIISFWKKNDVRKNWKIICIGGGITQDVTTIASSLYLRNIDWYFIPTTLLAMCDSCIGGKCGINLGHHKNQIGVFYPPKKIFIDTRFLDTLSQDDYLNGWGELLKFSLTSDPAFYEMLKSESTYIPCEKIDSYIYKGLMTKKQVIEADEFESDYRRVLNYGHTFGHALEAYTGYKVPHGKAVMWGIDAANYIAWLEGLITQSTYLDVKALIRQSFIKKEIPVENADELFQLILTDKKVRGSRISLAVPDAVGHLIVHTMDIDHKLQEMFINYVKETHEYYND